jgi:hypothetical protein
MYRKDQEKLDSNSATPILKLKHDFHEKRLLKERNSTWQLCAVKFLYWDFFSNRNLFDKVLTSNFLTEE